MNKKVSIIVPVYNSEKTIIQCIESILSQSYKNIEIIIVDDGSSDKSYELCKNLLKNNKNINLFKKDNGGVSLARNYGIDKAIGDYICFVDSDDIVSKNYINDFLEMLSKYNCNLVSCECLTFKKNIKLNNEFFKKEYQYIGDEKFELLFSKASGYVCNKIYLSKIIKENNILFENNIYMSEDLLFNYKYLLNCEKAIHFSGFNYYYRMSETSLSNNLKNIKWFTALEVYKIILNENKLSKKTKINAIYNYLMLIFETKVRSKFISNTKYNINYLNSELIKYKKYFYNFSVRQKIKITLFKYIPQIIFRYRRRGV